MKKQNKSSINDLMAKLGASLRESPLKAHERQGQKKEKELILSNERLPSAEPRGGEGEAKVAVVAAAESDATLRLKRAMEKAQVNPAAAPQVATETPTVAIDATKVYAQHPVGGFADMTPEEVLMLKRDHLEYMERMLKEKGVELAEQNRAQTLGYARPAPMAPSYQGWKTSTVGLYPEDYDKARAVMNYIQQQTGESANLSRVVKIALRALEISPRTLEINAQIRGKDGRTSSRRRLVAAGM